MICSGTHRIGFKLFISLLIVGGFVLHGVPLHAQAPASQPTRHTLAPSNGPVTVEDVEQALDRRDFSNAVKIASKLLALRGKSAEGLNRHRLYTLKAEGQIGQKLGAAAIESLQASLKETTDPHEQSVTRGTMLLLKRSSGMTYVPKTTPPDGTKPGPIDLSDRDKRKTAFAALLDDELVALGPRIKTANTAQSLLVIFPVLQQVEDLHALDILANGSDDKTMQITGTLVEHARTLITTTLKGMWQRVDDIEKLATQTTPIQQILPDGRGGTYVQSTQRKNGLSQPNKSELNDIITTCEQIQSAATAFTPSAKDDRGWAAITSDSTRVSSRARDVLNADYGDMTVGQRIPGGYNTGGTIVIPQGTTQRPTTPTTPAPTPKPPTTKGTR